MEAAQNLEKFNDNAKKVLLNLGVVSGVGSAFPETFFTQTEIKKIFALKNRVVNKLMDSGHIEKRHLYLDKIDPETGALMDESPLELQEKFKKGVKDIGVKAALAALNNSQTQLRVVGQFESPNVTISSIDQICLLTPAAIAGVILRLWCCLAKL